MKNIGPNSTNGTPAEVDSKLSSVASSPRKSGAVLVILIITLCYLIYTFVWKNKSGKVTNPSEVSKNIETVEAPKLDTNININNAPLLPEPPELQAPEAPPAPIAEAPPPPPLEQPPAIVPETIINTSVPPLTDIEAPNVLSSPIAKGQVSLQERRRSGIMAVGGGGGGRSGQTTPDGKAVPGADGTTKVVAADAGPYVPPVSTNFTPSRTSFAQQRVTQLGDLRYVVAQGKVIDAILETGINTEYPGVVRAIVSRDIYSEAGKNVLVPKGSRLIGTFAADDVATGVRIAIMWNRLIRPDGIDIAVESPAIDDLGRSALKAELDSKLFDLLSNTLLTSVIKIGVSKAGEKILGGDGTINETISKDDKNKDVINRSGTVTAFATKGAVDDIGNVLTGANKRLLDAKRTLHLHQGTSLKVFVNRDLIFSASFNYGGKLVQ